MAISGVFCFLRLYFLGLYFVRISTPAYDSANLRRRLLPREDLQDLQGTFQVEVATKADALPSFWVDTGVYVGIDPRLGT